MIKETTKQKFAALREIMESDRSFDSKRAESLITDLKLEFLAFDLMTPNELKLSDEEICACVCMYRSVLEYDALFSIQTINLEEFERAMTQLKCYYFRYRELPPSENMPLLLAINLVSILGERQKEAKVKLVEFNIEMQIARELIEESEFLDYAENLYQSFIDNSFSRLFILEEQPPCPLFNQFTAELLISARNNHADSIERSYKHLNLSELKTILHFNDLDEAHDFVSKRDKWKLENDDFTVVFDRVENHSKSPNDMLALSIDLSKQISNLA